MNLPELISENCDISEPPPPVHPLPLEDVTRTNGEKAGQPKFEAFVMTGDRVLKICRTQQGIFHIWYIKSKIKVVWLILFLHLI